MMPEKDGMETLQEIRKNKTIPVILLSAKSEDYDKISGLDTGADDYITKPFNPLELIARVKSNVRRYVEFGNISKKENKKVLKTGDLEIDDDTKNRYSYEQLYDIYYDDYSLFGANFSKVDFSKSLNENGLFTYTFKDLSENTYVLTENAYFDFSLNIS